MTVPDSTGLHPDIERYLGDRADELGQIAPERKRSLKKIAAYIKERAQTGEPATLTFICTHTERTTTDRNDNTPPRSAPRGTTNLHRSARTLGLIHGPGRARVRSVS